MKTVEVEPTADGRGLWWRTYARVPDEDPRTSCASWRPRCKHGQVLVWSVGAWRHDDTGGQLCEPVSWERIAG